MTISIQGGRDPVAESSEHRSLPDLCAALRPPLLWRHSERHAKFVRTVKVCAGTSAVTARKCC